MGLVRCIDGKITEEFHTFIRPPVMFFRSDFIDIHGITPDIARSYGTFDVYWEKIRDFISDSVLVAHNAPFDRSVLFSCLTYFNLPIIGNAWECSCRKARSYFPNVLKIKLQNYRLGSIADFYDIKFQSHDALEDARTCALIMARMRPEKNQD